MKRGPTRTDLILDALKIKVARRRGPRAWTYCPFHDADTPTTFFIRTYGTRAGNYHCFSCKESGPLSGLVMQVRSCTYEEAKAFILDAGKGYEAPRARVRVVAREPKLTLQRFLYPREIITVPFGEWDTLPSRYAVERGITPEDISRFEIGYAVDGPLAGRLVFPVRDFHSKRIESYSARTFVDEEPKYKTPNESDKANLDILFGEHLWPPPGDGRDEVIVTEGALDVLAAMRVTKMLGCSLGGSDVRTGHISSLASFRRVIVMTDADEPGDKAARSITSRLARYTEVLRVRLVGTDAAKLALKNPDFLKAAIGKARLQKAS